jgi:hypothetical protein
MKAEQLHAKIMLEAEHDWKKQWKKERQELVQRRAVRPPTKSEQDRKKLSQLRIETATIERELDLRKEVEVESKRNREARMKLYEADLTAEEKRERDEDIHRMQVYASLFCKEASPDWREQATAEFRSKKL